MHTLTNECSTLKGDHPGFGTTPAEQEKCARELLKHATYTASLDGTAIAEDKLIVATGVFFVPKVVGATAHTAYSAAYGPGLLLRGLPEGTHTIHQTANVPKVSKGSTTFTVQVS